MTAVVIGVGWALAVVAFLAVAVGLCKAAAMGDDIARRALGPGSSSTDLQLGLMVALDEAGGPPAERRRQP